MKTVIEELYLTDDQISEWDEYILPFYKTISEKCNWIPTIKRIERFGSRAVIEREEHIGAPLDMVLEDLSNNPEFIAKLYNLISFQFPGDLNHHYLQISKKTRVYISLSIELSHWIIKKNGDLVYNNLKKIRSNKGLPFQSADLYASFMEHFSFDDISEHPLYKQRVREVKERNALLELQKNELKILHRHRSNSIHKDKLKETFGINLYNQMGFPQVFGDDDES